MKRLFSILVIFALFICNYSLVFAEEMLKEETNMIEINTVETAKELLEETENTKTTAEEQPTETKNAETNSDIISLQSKYKRINEFVTSYNEGNVIGVRKFGMYYIDRKSLHKTSIDFDNENDSEKITQYLTLMEKFIDIVTDNKGDVFTSEAEYLEKHGENPNSSVYFYMKLYYSGYLQQSNSIFELKLECILEGNKLELGNLYAYVPNPEKVTTFVLENIENGLLPDNTKSVEIEKWHTNFRYDPVNYDITAPREKIVYRLQDKMEFDIVPDESYYDTVFEDVGELGEPVRITIENIQGGTRFVLTIEGSKATKKFWTEEDGWDFNASNTENGLVFSCAEYIKGNTQYRIIETANTYIHPKIAFTGKVSDGKISKIQMKVIFNRVGETNVVSASDIHYTYYGNEKKYRLDEKVSLIRKFGIDRSAAAIRLNRQQGENFLEQDIENWKTDLRYEDDEVEFDFSVNYAAKVRLNEVSGNIPAWLKQLGKKPELTIIGLNTTCNGEENINYPILSFNGNGKTQWFAMSKMSDSQTDSSLDDSTIYVRFNSMKSFDNFVKIENLEDYYTVGMYLHYNKAGDVEELGSIDLVINENKTITILADEIDSILGGDKIYESWM